MIVAGAGSGKTLALERRMMHLMSSGLAMPHQILAITFTKKAAAELRHRVQNAMRRGMHNKGMEMVDAAAAAASSGSSLSDNFSAAGRPSGWGPDIRTFHSLGFRIIQRYYDLCGFSRPPSCPRNGESKALLIEILREWCRKVLDGEEGGGGGGSMMDGSANPSYQRLQEVVALQNNAGTHDAVAGIGDKLRQDLQESKSEGTIPFSTPRPLDLPPGKPERLTRQENTILGYFRAFIHRAKSGGYHPAQFEAGEHRFVLERYLQEYRKRCWLEFEDMVPMAVTLFDEHPRVWKEVQSRYRHVLVDEWQDVSEEQLRLMCHICGEEYPIYADSHNSAASSASSSASSSSSAGKTAAPMPAPIPRSTLRAQSICIAGDDDQSIYSWRGSVVDSFRVFHRAYPSALTAILTQSYRSTQHIVKGCAHLIQHNQYRTPKTVRTERPDGEKIRMVQCKNLRAEVAMMAREIKRQTRTRTRRQHRLTNTSAAAAASSSSSSSSSVPDPTPLRYSDIAILCRCRRFMPQISKLLREEYGIPVNHSKKQMNETELSVTADDEEQDGRGRTHGSGSKNNKSKRKKTQEEKEQEEREEKVFQTTLRTLHRNKDILDALAYADLIACTGPSGERMSDEERKSVDVAFKRVINVPRRGLGASALDVIQRRANERNVCLLHAAEEICGRRQVILTQPSSSPSASFASQPPRLKAAQQSSLSSFLDLIDHLRFNCVFQPVEVAINNILEETGLKLHAIDILHEHGDTATKEKAEVAYKALRRLAKEFDQHRPHPLPPRGKRRRNRQEEEEEEAEKKQQMVMEDSDEDDFMDDIDNANGVAEAQSADHVSNASSRRVGNVVASHKRARGTAMLSAAVSSATSSASATTRASRPVSGVHPDLDPQLFSPLLDFTAAVRAGGCGSTDAGSALRSNSVLLTTIHQAKGLEWPLVFVAHMNEGNMPPMAGAGSSSSSALVSWEEIEEDGVDHAIPRMLTRAQKKRIRFAVEQSLRFDPYEEERRLAYVAMSRAKESLVLSYSISDGPNPCTPSPFIHELPLACVQEHSASDNGRLGTNKQHGGGGRAGMNGSNMSSSSNDDDDGDDGGGDEDMSLSAIAAAAPVPTHTSATGNVTIAAAAAAAASSSPMRSESCATVPVPVPAIPRVKVEPGLNGGAMQASVDEGEEDDEDVCIVGSRAPPRRPQSTTMPTTNGNGNGGIAARSMHPTSSSSHSVSAVSSSHAAQFSHGRMAVKREASIRVKNGHGHGSVAVSASSSTHSSAQSSRVRSAASIAAAARRREARIKREEASKPWLNDFAAAFRGGESSVITDERLRAQMDAAARASGTARPPPSTQH